MDQPTFLTTPPVAHCLNLILTGRRTSTPHESCVCLFLLCSAQAMLPEPVSTEASHACRMRTDTGAAIKILPMPHAGQARG